MRKLAIPLVLLLVASAALAAGLSKRYKNWDSSPEAYFLTNTEKEQWKKVKTDAEAQNFILDYKARRGPDFEKMLNERIAVADKHFSSGETKGSETLRGKVVIVFGPPSSIERGAGESGKPGSDPNRVEGVMGGGRGAGPTISSAGTAGPMSPAAGPAQNPIFTFVYDKDAAPQPIGKPFRVELKMYSDVEQEPTDPKGFDKMLEKMAEGSMIPPETPKEQKPR